MAQANKVHSLRLFVLFVIGATLLLFGLLFFFIFHSTMPEMLLRAERNYLEKQRSVVSGLLGDAHEHIVSMADDTGVWEETAAFVTGRKPDYIAANWPGTSPLQTYSFNLLVIKDASGRDVHTEFHDYVADTPLPVPAGFAQALNALSREALAKCKPGMPVADVRERGRHGLFFYKGVAYDLAVMPVMDDYDSPPVGTITMGRILDDAYLRSLTHYATTTFSLVQGRDNKPETIHAIYRKSADEVITTIVLEDIEENPAYLRLCAERPIFTTGQEQLRHTMLLMGAALLVLGFALYGLVAYFILRPVESLSRDVTSLGATDTLNVGKYASSREIATLGTSINAMIATLNASKISMNVLQRILDGIDAFVYVTDPATDRILFINHKMSEHYGISDAIGKRCWEVLQDGQDGRCDFCPVNKLGNAPGTICTWEEESTKTGRIYRNTDTMILWSDNKPVHLQYSADITDIRNAETTLKQRLRQQELMSAMAQAFIASTDRCSVFSQALHMAGQFMDVSKILLARYDPDTRTLVPECEWYNETYPCFRPESTAIPFVEGTPEYDAFITQKLQYMASDDITVMDEFHYASGHGVQSLVGVAVQVDGEFWGMLSFNECCRNRAWTESDIHLIRLIGSVISGVLLRSATEEKLLRMSSIVARSPLYISYISPDGQFKYMNNAVPEILGYTHDELLSNPLWQLFDPPTNQLLRETIIPDILRNGRAAFELPIIRKDGAVRLMSFSAFVADSESKDIGAIATDVTELRLIQKELTEAKELAERSSTAKSEFLSRMSHEMRTPMNAIIGMTAIAKASDDPVKKEYCLDKIDDASTHLLGVINDILDMSKIEANKFELSFTEFDIERTLMRVINVVNFRVDEKQQTMVINIDPALPQSIISDDQRLSQVLTNLLSNAVKFTPEHGTISLSAGLLHEEKGFCTLQFSVTDSGIGIPLEQQNKLFRSFEQADGGIARKFGGTGLGLAISKSIVEMMGGDIWVSSEEGKGSTFTFTVKAQQGSAARKSLLSSEIRWDTLRVLVVDDAPEVREYFLNLAESIGLYCEVAASGKEACARIEANAATPFNIIFADWKMPEMDGIELTRLIKTRYGAKAVVIMISAAAWHDVEKEAADAGVDRFLPKPLFSSLIVDCINQCLDSKHTAEETALEHRDTAENCFAGNHILLAEDIDINREIVMSLLEHTGIVIDCAENGRQAVEMFTANPDTYDMIFMDIHMPEVDGYEATRRIRNMDVPRAAAIPIVAMTANVFREDIERCLAAGMNDHVGKPIDVEEMFEKLRTYMRPC